MPTPSLPRSAAGPVRAVVLCLATIALAGCSLPSGKPEAGAFDSYSRPQQNTVAWETRVHRIAFADGATQPSSQELARLDAFLVAYDADRGAQIAVEGARSGDHIATDREKAILAVLRARRLDATPLPDDRTASPGENTVAVVLGHYKVTAPACPNWSKPATTDYQNTMSSNFGCASATNLGLMVANPADLQRGRDMGPTDGAAATLAIQRYRAGDVEELERDDSAAVSVTFE